MHPPVGILFSADFLTFLSPFCSFHTTFIEVPSLIDFSTFYTLCDQFSKVVPLFCRSFFKKNQSYPQIVFNLGWYLSVLLSLDLYPCISKEEDGLQLSQNIDID